MGNQLKSISPSPRPYKGMKTIIALAMLFSLTLAQAKFSLDMSKLETQVAVANPTKSTEVSRVTTELLVFQTAPREIAQLTCQTARPQLSHSAPLSISPTAKTTVSCSARESLRESAHSGPSAPTPATLPLSACTIQPPPQL